LCADHLLSVANGSDTAYKILFCSCKAPLGRERVSVYVIAQTALTFWSNWPKSSSARQFISLRAGSLPAETTDPCECILLAELRECQTLFPFASQFAKCFARCATVRVLLIMDAPCVRARCVLNVIIRKRCMPRRQKGHTRTCGQRFIEIDTLVQTLHCAICNQINRFGHAVRGLFFFWVCGRGRLSSFDATPLQRETRFERKIF
jgi:hypothetical protein